MSIWPEVMASLKVLVFQGAQLHEDQGGGQNVQSVNLSDSEGRSLVVNPMASLVQVTAEWDRVRRVAELLDRLEESLQRQVAIEVQHHGGVPRQRRPDRRELAGHPAGGRGDALNALGAGENIGETFFQFVVNSADVRGVLEVVERSGDLRTVSTPRVTTLNNQKAVVRVVTEDVYYEATVEPAIITNGVGTEPVVNYTPRIVPVGVVLDVTPQVGRDRVITLNVHPTISDVVAVAQSPNQDTTPILSIRELDTVGKVRDGQTLVIAGLHQPASEQGAHGLAGAQGPAAAGLPLRQDVRPEGQHRAGDAADAGDHGWGEGRPDRPRRTPAPGAAAGRVGAWPRAERARLPVGAGLAPCAKQRVGT
jgi:type II secretory pathway component GspD/PulD (secretin)